MDIIFANRKLEKFANDFSLAQRKLGKIQAELLHKRLNDLYDAENFSVLFDLPGHHHPLTENRNGQWACSLEQPSRLIYKPIIPTELAQSEEQIKLAQFVEVSVIEITDYHDKKKKR
ncbi:MAG: killer suppression protein HigA [Bacteroidetes bacterium]|nr:killer suppression protein HigA [Bacteroidota bacterium]